MYGACQNAYNEATGMQTYSLIVGIGNPEDDYGKTYHNAGILAVNYLSQKGRSGTRNATWESAWNKHFRFLRGQEGAAIFVIPTGFMNESGRGIKEALEYFNTAPDNLLVIHDDSDLPLGEFKISSGQGSAGHKGIASIIEALGTKAFARARIGIRSAEHPDQKRMKAEEFVLKKISARDEKLIAYALKTLGDRLTAGT